MYDLVFLLLTQGVEDDDAWLKWNTPPLARTRESILREAGKTVGKPGFSVKRPPIATLPANDSQPIDKSVPPDLLHARMRVGERLVQHFFLS